MRIRKPKDTITWSKVLTLQEQHQLMSYLKSKADTIAGERLFLICDLMLNTGLRITELATPSGLSNNNGFFTYFNVLLSQVR